MIQNIQKRPQWQRVLIFAALVTAVVVIIFVTTLGVGYLGVNAGPRNQSIAMQDNLTVREWAVLPGDDAYPAALTIDPDGNVYTSSYVSGAIWRITPDGIVTELPRTRDAFGAVTGLVWTDEGLYVLDRKNALGESGMTVWRWREDATATLYNEDTSNRFPYDLARDAQGNLYISAIVIGNESEIMRLTPQLEMSVWWKAPKKTIITGLTYQAASDTLLAVDTNASDIYAIPAANPTASTLLYHNTVNPAPQFDGLTAAADGTIYIAALGLNRVAALSPTLDLTYLAGAFRGSSRVAYDAVRRRLYVNNWDQRSLLADQMLFVKIDVTPKLPFALDVIEWK